MRHLSSHSLPFLLSRDIKGREAAREREGRGKPTPFHELYDWMIFSAVFRPSTAELMIPPACPAPSPAG